MRTPINDCSRKRVMWRSRLEPVAAGINRFRYLRIDRARRFSDVDYRSENRPAAPTARVRISPCVYECAHTRHGGGASGSIPSAGRREKTCSEKKKNWENYRFEVASSYQTFYFT